MSETLQLTTNYLQDVDVFLIAHRVAEVHQNPDMLTVKVASVLKSVIV